MSPPCSTPPSSSYDRIIVDDNSYCDRGFGFEAFDNKGPFDTAGPSQTYSGAELLGDISGYPDSILAPLNAPISLSPDDETYTNEGYATSSCQGIGPPPSLRAAIIPSSIPPYTPFVTTPPIPTCSHGFSPFAKNSRALPIIPVVQPSPAHLPPYGGGEQYSPCATPIHVPTLPVGMGNTISGVPLSIPSSSGPERIRRPAGETRRHNPFFSARKTKVDFDSEGWDQTLVRFRAHLDEAYIVHDGQPSGGIVPEKALARLNEFIKEDLRRSPLRDTEAGRGKRSRSSEAYLVGLLQAIRPTGGESDEFDTATAALSKLADELEAKLAVVNQHLALRQWSTVPGVKGEAREERTEKQRRRSELEKGRRVRERRHIERISRLFRAKGSRTKKDVILLAVLFLLRGPSAFPCDFIQVLPVTEAAGTS